MTNNKTFFKQLYPCNDKQVILANGKSINVKGHGEGILECIVEGIVNKILVKDVLYIPELENNLISVQKLTNQGFIVDFIKDKCTISKENKIFAVAKMESSLYKLQCVEKANLAWDGNSRACIHGWHRRLGHREPEVVRKTLFFESKTTIDNCKEKLFCESCIRGKMTKLPFPEKSENKSNHILDLVHTDLCGPMQTLTPSYNKYILTLIDDYSRYTVIFLLKNKYEVKDCSRVGRYKLFP